MAGKPLLGVNEGFTKYQVTEGVTGELFEPTVEDVRHAVREFDPDDYDPEEIREAGRAYDVTHFRDGIRRVVAEVADETAAGPSRPATAGEERHD